MIRSMTAFGSSESTSERFAIRWEMRSVNHRYLDINLRLPDYLRALEPDIRSAISKKFKRGKLDCVLTCYQQLCDDASIGVDLPKIKRLLAATEQVESLMTAPLGYSALEIMKWPGVQVEPDIDTEQLSTEALSVLTMALNTLLEAREREGAQLALLIEDRCVLLREQVGNIRARLPQLADNVRKKLESRLGELRTTVEPVRFEQEVVMLLHKMDIDEEVDRLATHIDEVLRVIKQNEPIGRRLDFLLQEMNREANTLGSKSTEITTTQAAVEIKVLIEQMREQVQNIE